MKRQKIEGLTPKRRFRTVFTEDVMIFLSNQDIKARQKILANIRKAEVVTDHELFKKLTEDIWEFRTLWNRQRFRLLAFWDKDDGAVVVVSHGFVKKTSKVPLRELEKAIRVRNEYLMLKNK